jgi:hypothetical protein
MHGAGNPIYTYSINTLYRIKVGCIAFRARLATVKADNWSVSASIIITALLVNTLHLSVSKCQTEPTATSRSIVGVSYRQFTVSYQLVGIC